MKLTGIVRQLRTEKNRAETELKRLDAALEALASLNGSFRGARPRRGGEPMSAAGRARIAAAQRARWAKLRGTKSTRSKAPIPIQAKRRISAAGLAHIRAPQKARWAKLKKQQKAA